MSGYIHYWEGVWSGHDAGGPVTDKLILPPYLFLLLRSPRPRGDLRTAAREYLVGQPWFEEEEDRLAFRQKDSDCRFVVYLQPVSMNRALAEPPPVPGANQLVVLLRTLQPRVYPGEVVEALEPLVRALDLEMGLPQDPDPGFGPWSPSRILLAWRNLHQKALATWRSPPFNLEGYVGRLPAAEIEAIWNWNRSRRDREAVLEEDVFIPLIDYFDLGNGPQTRVSWPDGIPAYLPKVDFVLAGFGTQREGQLGKPEFMTWVPWAALEPLLARYPTLQDFPNARRLVYQQPPPDLMEVLRNGLRVRQPPFVVPFNRVLAAEDFRIEGPLPATAPG